MRLLLLSVLALSISGAGCSAEEVNTPTVHHNPSSSTPPGEATPPINDGVTPPVVGTPPPQGTVLGDETWADGKQIASNVTIGAGKTVTIAPGAKVTVASGAAITVLGTLKATTSAMHAKLTGTDWTALVIGSGGTLTADSLDIEGAGKGVWTQKGNTAATFANGIITAQQPLVMEAGSTLSITKSAVNGKSESAIAGTFVASYMTYDKAVSEGFAINDPAATVTITDSTLKGNGGGDYVVSAAAHKISVSYTAISGSHCPFHFNAVDQFTIDHVSDNVNGYGPMFYGSGAGPNTISYSNLQDTTYGYDVQNKNGTVTIDHSYAPGNKNVDTANTATVVVTNAADAPIATAKPR